MLKKILFKFKLNAKFKIWKVTKAVLKLFNIVAILKNLKRLKKIIF